MVKAYCPPKSMRAEFLHRTFLDYVVLFMRFIKENNLVNYGCVMLAVLCSLSLFYAHVWENIWVTQLMNISIHDFLKVVLTNIDKYVMNHDYFILQHSAFQKSTLKVFIAKYEKQKQKALQVDYIFQAFTCL